jgi:transcriptional regulator with XRE-family HTH domain
MRLEAKRSLGELARHLEVSIVYVSDIERDRRSPLSLAKIIQASKFLNARPDKLLRAAAESKGTFDLDVRDYPPVALELLSGLAKGRRRDEIYEQMLDILKKGDSDDRDSEGN